jgi:hypothetical protein
MLLTFPTKESLIRNLNEMNSEDIFLIIADIKTRFQCRLFINAITTFYAKLMLILKIDECNYQCSVA